MSTIRLLHTADWHFGSKGPHKPTTPKMQVAFENLRLAAFFNMLDRALSEKVNAILIAGDLFDNPHPPESTTKAVFAGIAALGHMPVHICTGNHDYYTLDGPYRGSNLPQNVILHNESTFGVHFHHDPDFCVAGWGWNRPRAQDWPAWTLSAPDLRENGPIVLMGHGSEIEAQPAAWKRYAPFMLSELPIADVRYLALGHLHWHQILPGNERFAAIYPGSGVALGFEEGWQHGYVLAEITEQETSIEFIPTNGLEFHRATAAVHEEITGEELVEILTKNAPANKTLTVVDAAVVGLLEQKKTSEIQVAHRILAQEFPYVRLRDFTVDPRYVTAAQSHSLALGHFLNCLKQLRNGERDQARLELLQRVEEHAFMMAGARVGGAKNAVLEAQSW